MQEDPQAGRLDTQISTLQSGQKRLQKRGLPAFAGSQAGRGFWQVVVAAVVSARWRVVRSLLGLDPKLPLLWSTDLGNVGEREGWMHEAMRCTAMRCDAKCDARVGHKGMESHPLCSLCVVVSCVLL